MTNNNLDSIPSTQLASISGGKTFPDSRWPSPGPRSPWPSPGPRFPSPNPGPTFPQPSLDIARR